MAQQDAPRRTVHRMGESALLVDCADLDDVLGLHASLSSEPLPDQAELVPAATTLLVRFRTSLTGADAVDRARCLTTARRLDPGSGNAPEITIPVVYDGEDLSDVARRLGCSVDDVVARHTRARWTAAFGGFAPGFSYLVQHGATAQQELTVPRRESPRTRVPAGSVALAGAFSAVYPCDSPGGWQLVGRTETPMWDLRRDPPALVGPGAVVRFEAVREHVTGGAPAAPARDAIDADPDVETVAEAPDPDDVELQESAVPDDAHPATEEPALRVNSPGLSTLVQDAGRPGHADWGVSPSGWADPLSAREANRLVGNSADTAVLENTAGGLRLTARRDLVLTVTGARTTVTATGEDGPVQLPQDRPFALVSGQEIALGPTTHGLRAYVAVRGGIRTETVLGSASADTLSGLGPRALRRGDHLFRGEEPRQAVRPVAAAVVLPPQAPQALVVPLRPGPRADWFTDESVRELGATDWVVSQQSNRVAARLALPDEDGAAPEASSPLRRTPEAQDRELPSEGLVAGAVQIPPDGNPIVFLTDHPVTGGYPVLGVVGPADLRMLAQAPPGSRVRLVVDPGRTSS